jgi:uncharacterized GH25 family protein
MGEMVVKVEEVGGNSTGDDDGKMNRQYTMDRRGNWREKNERKENKRMSRLKRKTEEEKARYSNKYLPRYPYHTSLYR